MKLTLIQMNSQENKPANLAQARMLIERVVAEDRPDMIALPETFTLLAETRAAKLAGAEDLPGGEAYAMLAELAARHKVFIHGGSLLERDGAERCFNTTVAFDRSGREIARYRKMHLFDVVTPDGKEYRESATIGRGQAVVTYQAEDITVGCSICYDLRFPELYQALAKKGAQLIMVPAAFTLQTGKDHWEVLLRARAIETECYVAAPGQCGTYHNGTRANYGHSLVAGPWGHVIAKAQDKVGFVTARLDLDVLSEMRRNIPVAQHKVLA